MIQPATSGMGGTSRPISDLYRQRGFTLIEIMVTLVLLSILVLGLSGLWTSVNSDFLFLTVKQKAIFVLNGEMSRLSALYRFTDVRTLAGTTEDVVIDGNNRTIYLSTGGLGEVGEIVTTDAAVFNCATSTSALASACADQVYFLAGAAGPQDRAYVWIDQERNITGILSWEIVDVTGVGGAPLAANCANRNPAAAASGDVGGEQLDDPPGTGALSCQELTVYLKYPFRYKSGADPGGDVGFGKEEELFLKTIVGRRP